MSVKDLNNKVDVVDYNVKMKELDTQISLIDETSSILDKGQRGQTLVCNNSGQASWQTVPTITVEDFVSDESFSVED